MPTGIYQHHSHQGFQRSNKINLDKPSNFLGKHHTKKSIKKMKLIKSGGNHPMWKGGKKKNGEGYWLIWKPEHPFADKQHYIKQSRLVAEKCLKRYLTEIEIIHHINRIKYDDRPENLYLFKNRSEHTNYHWQIKKGIANKLISNLILP